MRTNREVIKELSNKDFAHWCCDDAMATQENKDSFGDIKLSDVEELNTAGAIDIVGTCTDICVISNALILKAAFPEKEIRVFRDLCAGSSPEAHEAALKVMANCQVVIADAKAEGLME